MSELKMPLRKLLSSRTKSLREKRGLKQRHMAEALRITDRAYNGIEREKYGLSALTLMFLLEMMTGEERESLIDEFRRMVYNTEGQTPCE